ncbi:MAG: 50S ribosomal protein L10 [Oscillospiraceae bacterium]|nr:50S ribosomal protein L10 [Oscillospiraceae bacterium]
MPSAKILANKQEVLSKLTEQLKASPAGVVVNYYKTTVEDDTKLRKELREAGVDYKVIKNTMLRFAFNNVGYEAMDSQLNGMTAIAISEKDPVIAAKIISKFADSHKDYEIKAGYVEGEVIDADGVKELAAIPPKEMLIAKLLGSLQSSLYGLAYVLQAKIDKENEASASAEAAPAEAAPAEAQA